jgi:hypothetical protein
MTQARVIDIIPITERLRANAPALDVPFAGDGIQVILEPTLTTTIDTALRDIALITRPDGSTLSHPIAGADVGRGACCLYFEHLDLADIPRLSMISW